jgi:hypothetical protein
MTGCAWTASTRRRILDDREELPSGYGQPESVHHGNMAASWGVPGFDLKQGGNALGTGRGAQVRAVVPADSPDQAVMMR